jgi:hypothetical protein
MTMIDLANYDIFTDHVGSLKELSKDDHSTENIQFMTQSSVVAVNFDQVKRAYANNLGISEDKVYSVDGISYTEDSIIFLEFKNGSNINNREVHDKIRDSLLLFCDITKTNISFTQKNAILILVFNEQANPIPNQYTRHIQPSPSRSFISKVVAQKGNKEIIICCLDRFEKLYFREVHTYSQEEFESYIPQLISM